MKSFFDWLSSLFKKLEPVVPSQPAPIDVETSGVPKEVQRVYAAMKESGKFNNPRFIAEMDYSINSKSPRLFIYDLTEKKLYKHKASHGVGGKNSSPHDGKCREVSNINGSHMSCLGLFKCAETYNGGNGYSMRLDGLSATNSNARKRLIVVHGSDYVKDAIRHEGLDSKIVEQLARVRESLARLEGYFSGSTSSGNNLKKD
jgi:hypothetical protein